MQISTFVLAENSEGSAEILRIETICSQAQYAARAHCDAAREYASSMGYCVLGVFDGNDGAARAIDYSRVGAFKTLNV